MFLRKFFFWIIPLFCLSFLFGESFILFAVGGVAKLYFRLHKGWELDYESIQWKNRGFVFTDLTLKNISVFSINAPEVTAFLQAKHLAIDRPQVFLYQIPESSDSDGFPWTCSVTGGTVDGAGLHKASFTFEKDTFENHGLLRINWEGSSVNIEACSQLGGSVINVNLEGVHLSSFHHWLEKGWNGVVNGSLHLVKEGGLWTSCGGCLEGTDISYKAIFKGLSGNIDWEAPLGLSDLSYDKSSVDLERIFDQGRLRLSILDGNLCLNKKHGKNLQSNLSFDGKSGAKWEFSLACNNQKIEGSGRGFFHSLKERWIESELHCDEGSLLVQGRENNGLFICDLNAKAMNVEMICFLQDIVEFTEIFPCSWSMKEGLVSGSGQIICGGDPQFDWKLFDCSLENLRLESDLSLVSCKQACLKEGIYSFHGGSFSVIDGLSCLDWNGECNLSSGLAKMSGKIGDLFVDCEAEKMIDFLRPEKMEDWVKARLKIQGEIGGDLVISAQWKDETFHFIVEEGSGTLFSFAHIENLQMRGEVNGDGFSCYDVKGICDLGKKIPFYCPFIQSNGAFDIRFEKEIFQLVRLAGTIEQKKISFDQTRSHFCGVPISFAKASFSEKGLECLQTQCSVPWEMLSFFFEIPSSLLNVVAISEIACQFSYEKGKGTEIELSGEVNVKDHLFDFLFSLHGEDSLWRLNPSRIGGGVVDGVLMFGKEGVSLSQASATWKEGNRAEFTGKLLSLDEWSLNISRLHIDLQTIRPLQERGVKGFLDGEGLIHWKGSFESDFDVIASHLSLNDFILENREPLHLFCSSQKGVFIRGVNISVLQSGIEPPMVDCKIGLLQYDLEQSLFVLTQSQLHLTSDLIDQLPYREKIPLNRGESLYLTADVSSSLDFSSFSCSMKEANIPLQEKSFHIRDFHLEIHRKELKVSFDLDHQNRWIPMDLLVQLNQDLYPRFLSESIGNSYQGLVTEIQNKLQLLPSLGIKGRLIIENGMKIDWAYEDRLVVQTIEGKCAGIDASFHREGDSLIGSARFNCNELKGVVSPDIAQVFNDLKMGDGYELMGRVYIGEEGVLFNGILSGKQIELFGFQLRNLLAQIELAPDHVHISDIKISDFAGVLKIDQVIARGVGDAPWTISIPHISVKELRPSLLQDVGGPPGKLSPLVIRNLEIYDFKGFVEDSKTYTAHGELFFINSYKREKSILEIPSDFLSRIVGLDLDLMIPVCGTLRYELREGLFHFTELEGSYSENKRSEFFLVYSDNSPTMDLDWNLNILIQMKQFVLFKFTESFIISVNGKLDDPKFHLQRKKRFLGVL